MQTPFRSVQLLDYMHIPGPTRNLEVARGSLHRQNATFSNESEMFLEIPWGVPVDPPTHILHHQGSLSNAIGVL